MSALSKKNTPYCANIDILRAIAVLSVVIHHIFALTGFHFPYFAEAGGYIGVQLFFIISGYLISESAIKHPLPDYVRHRFLRIFPAYWVAFIGVGLLSSSLTLPRVMDRPGSFLLSLLNLQQTYAVALLELDSLHVTWTLTVEMFWYILAPLVVIVYRRYAWLTLGGLALISLFWSGAAAQHQVDWLYTDGFSKMTQPVELSQYFVLINWAFPAQMVFFGLGALIYRYRQQAFRIGNTPLLLCIFASIGLLEHYINIIPLPPIPTSIGIAAFFILLIRSPAFDVPFLVHIGKISYSVYLLHVPVIAWCYHEWGNLGKAHLLLTMCFILALSHLLYVLVERPCIRYAQRFHRSVTVDGQLIQHPSS